MQRPKIRAPNEQLGELTGNKNVTDAMIYDMQTMYKKKREPSQVGHPRN
jgi:hypothetical protein